MDRLTAKQQEQGPGKSEAFTGNYLGSYTDLLS